MIVNTFPSNDIAIVNAVKDRKIICAFHDIDGTHSLIREWPPIMSICLYIIICVRRLKKSFLMHKLRKIRGINL